MKQLYLVGTHINFEYKFYNFFNKVKRIKNEWVQKNVKIIYAESQEEAIKKYIKWFFYEHEYIIKGWGDWYDTSDGVHIYMSDDFCNIIKQYPIVLKEEKDFKSMSIDYVKKHMMYSDFKDWWNSK